MWIVDLLNYDVLPEYHQYQDEGCDLFPSCLKCPLPRCRYDESGGRQQIKKELRNKEILRLYQKEGLKAEELAELFRVSKRTIHRVISPRESTAFSGDLNQEEQWQTNSVLSSS